MLVVCLTSTVFLRPKYQYMKIYQMPFFICFTSIFGYFEEYTDLSEFC